MATAFSENFVKLGKRKLEKCCFHTSAYTCISCVVSTGGCELIVSEVMCRFYSMK